MKNKYILIILIFFLGFSMNIIIIKYFPNESIISNIVKENNLHCYKDKLFWGNAKEPYNNTEISKNEKIEYCSEFRGIEIKTTRFISPCE